MPELNTITVLRETVLPRVDVDGSLATTQEGVSLINDEDAPGANKVYGTNASGVRGWKSDPTSVTSGAITTALGYTPESTSNKATDFTTVNDTKYPSVEAVKEYVPYISFESIGVLSSNTAAQNTTALQAAIDAVGSGVKRIFYGEGIYPLNGPIDLKSDIFILGNSVGMKGSAYGSRFTITDTTNNVFVCRSRTMIAGWVFDYPNNNLLTTTPASLTSYPATITGQAGVTVEQIYLRDLTIVGGSKFIEFIDTVPSQDFHIQHIYGYPLHGALINLSKCYDIPYISECHVNPGAGRGYRTSDATTGTPCSTQVIDYVINNAAPTYRIDQTDDFVINRIFAFGVKTGIQVLNSYGSIVQPNFDIVETGFDISIGQDRKAVQIIGSTVFPCGGSTPANRNAIKFTGAGGMLIVNNMNVQLGINGAVTSSSALANSIILIDGSGDQDVMMSNISGNSTGTFTYDMRRLNASSNISISNFDVKTTTTNYYSGQGALKGTYYYHPSSNFIDHAFFHYNTSTGTGAQSRGIFSNGADFLSIGCTGPNYSGTIPAATAFVDGFDANLLLKTGTAHDIIFQTNSVEHMRLSSGGSLSVSKTVTAAATTGAQTINKIAGTVNFAAGASSLVVTNSLVTASSIVLCTIRTNDSTAVIKNVVPAAGSFTIRLEANATAETSVGFFVIN